MAQFNGRLFMAPSVIETFVATGRDIGLDALKLTDNPSNMHHFFFDQSNISGLTARLAEYGMPIHPQILADQMRTTYANYNIVPSKNMIYMLNELNNMVFTSIVSDKGAANAIGAGNILYSKKYDLFAGESRRQNTTPGLVAGQLQPNALNRAFFTNANVDVIQERIMGDIRQKYGRTIGRQSDTELQIIMKSIYFQYGKNQPANIDRQVAELNQLVIRDAVERIRANIMQYEGYMNDIMRDTRPIMPNPQSGSDKGSKSYSMIV
jgi:hypothetical protein